MLPERGRRGFQVYADGMEASAGDKAKLLRYVRPGIIAELGCGAGAVLELLKKKFPQSVVIGADLNDEMVQRCRARFPGMEIRRHDVAVRLFDDETIDSIILCSVMHEVFSYKNYDYGAVRDTLRASAGALRRGGRLVIRDGVKPGREEAVYLTFLNEPARLKFIRFAKEFGSSDVAWREVDGRVQVARRDAMEFLTKYIYDVNWVHEVQEHFGVFTLAQWVDELRFAGLKVVHKESYLIPWLRDTHWAVDLKLEVRVEGKYKAGEWPHSTMLVVGEKG
jgi:SAM-dependent methyltransferase